MGNPKVLVAAPTFYVMKYCLKEFLESVKNFSYDNYDILLVDNSRNNDFFNELKLQEGIKVLKDETQEELPANRLVSSRNKILKYAFDEGYDYLFMMDSDVIPPRDIIEKLLECKKDVVSGIYYNYFKSSGVLKLLPVAWLSITPEEFELMKQQVRFPDHFTHKDLQRHMTQKEVDSGELIEVLYPSAGCMLLSREVFGKVRYGLVKTPEGKIATDDIYFFKMARDEGFKLYCYTKLKCSHLLEGKFKKMEDGSLLHPLSPDYEKI